MKSQATIREICTRKAMIPRMATDGSGRYGRFLTVGQIQQVHYDIGYSRRSRTKIPANIEAWAYIGEVGYDKGADLNDPNTIIWWRGGDETTLKLAAERARVDPDKIVLDPPIVIFDEQEAE